MDDNPFKNFKVQKEIIKQDKIEGEVFSFEDLEKGKSTRIKINKVNRVLGHGSYSDWVAEVNVELANETGSIKKTHDMVIKKYTEKGRVGKESARLDLEQSYLNYKALKKAGIPTWNTYRINIEHKMALMTLGVKQHETLFTTNDFADEESQGFKENPINEIDNLDEFTKNARSILEKANKHGYRLRADTFGIVFKPQANRSGVYKLDIIIADLDGLDKSTEPYYQENYGENLKECWEKENRDNLGIALFNSFPSTDDKKEKFKKSVMDKI